MDTTTFPGCIYGVTKAEYNGGHWHYCIDLETGAVTGVVDSKIIASSPKDRLQSQYYDMKKHAFPNAMTAEWFYRFVSDDTGYELESRVKFNVEKLKELVEDGDMVVLNTEQYPSEGWSWKIRVKNDGSYECTEYYHGTRGHQRNDYITHRNTNKFSEFIHEHLNKNGYEYDSKSDKIINVNGDSPKPQKEKSKTLRKFTPWELYETALKTPGVDRILVYGPPGVGKTHTAAMYFKDNGIDFEQITATEGDMVAEYRGMWVPAGEVFAWMHGLLVRGWTHNNGEGMPIIINEIDKFPLECMAILHGILDNPNIASLSLPNGQRVTPGPKFRLIATMNGIPADLSEALQSRFQVKINIQEPHDDALSILDDDVRKVAKNMILSKDANKRINFRQFLTFKEIRESVGDDMAAALAFGTDHYVNVLGAIRVGAYNER